MRFGLIEKLMLGTALSAVASPAVACERDVSTTAGVWSGYTMQDLGIPATENAVFQGDVTVSCGPWYGNAWLSYDLEASGSFGNRGFGDELDLTGGYATRFETPLGPVQFDASVAYWFLADFGETDDDMVAVRVDLARPIEVGALTITPAIELTQWIGLGVYDDALITTPRVNVDVPLGGNWSTSLELADSFGGVSGEDVWHVNLTATYREETWAGWFGAKVTESLDPFDEDPLLIAGAGISFNF